MQLTMRNQPAAPSGWPEGVWLRTPLPLWLSQTAAPTLGWGPETVLLGQNEMQRLCSIKEPPGCFPYKEALWGRGFSFGDPLFDRCPACCPHLNVQHPPPAVAPPSAKDLADKRRGHGVPSEIAALWDLSRCHLVPPFKAVQKGRNPNS